jgi:hypothetical protein
VTFDQVIDVTTFDESSFLLSAPPETPRVPPGGLVGPVAPVTGTDYVQGTFTFAVNTAGATIATFTPARPMRPNVKYTVLITTVVQTPSPSPVSLSANYTWSFTTGVLNLTTPPPQQPGPGAVGRIRKEDLRISPRSSINNDLHQIIIAVLEHTQKPTRQHSVRHPYPHLTRCIVAPVKTPSSDPLPEITSRTLSRPVFTRILAASGPVLDPGS